MFTYNRFVCLKVIALSAKTFPLTLTQGLNIKKLLYNVNTPSLTYSA